MAFCTIHLWLPTLLLSLVVLLLLLLEGRRQKWHRQLPPGPPKLPIIGNLHQIGVLCHRSLWQLSKKYGPVMLMQLGGATSVVVSSAEAAREVLKVHDHECCSRPEFVTTKKLSYNYMDIAFGPYGEYWREMRKLCALEIFSSKRVESFRWIREDEAWRMVDSIAGMASCGGVVDLKDTFFSFTENVTFRLAFGKKHRDSDRFYEMVRQAMSMLGHRSASDFFPSVGWIIDRYLTGFHQRLERCFDELDGFCQKVIDDHLNSQRMKPEQEDLIDVLLRLERQDEGVHFTKDHVKAIIMNVFLAGVETSAIAMEWAMAELIRSPKLLQKAQDEVRSCVGRKGRVSESELDELHFLKLVVKETLRLHPSSAFLIPRQVMSSFKLNGYDIHPKTRIEVNVWAIARDPSIWKDPEDFFPERFLDSPVDVKGHHFELLPFGAGRRGCPGMLSGRTMVELALANLLYHFDWKLPDGMKEEDMNMEEEGGQASVYLKLPLQLLPTIHI